MTKQFELVAERRNEIGKGASRRLRRLQAKVPGILYGGSEAALPLLIEHRFLTKALENEAFYSHILTIKIDGKEQKAILRDLQRHPYKPHILHFDLQRVSAHEKIHMQVPLHFVGEEEAPGVKESEGVVSHLMASIEIRCLPGDLPEFIEVDISKLGLDESLHLSQLVLPKGVEFETAVQPESDRDVAVVSIHLPRIEVVEEPVVAEEASAEVEATEQTASSGTEEASAEETKE
jgi:large subunit ribosomal protein L25